jgi:archaeal flagellar protein FlaG
MSSETITTALFLITAVIAAGVLINAVYPVVYSMAGTFSSTTHESDVRMRTDFKVIAAVASTSGSAQIWMKNIGSERIPLSDIQNGDVFFGAVDSFERLEYGTDWTEELSDTNGNSVWDPGETLKISITAPGLSSGEQLYFQFSLPNGVWRSNEFTVS